MLEVVLSEILRLFENAQYPCCVGDVYNDSVI